MFDFNLIQRGTLEYLEKTSLRQVDSPVKMVLSTRQDGLSGSRGGGGVLPYMGHLGMCRCEGYGFQAVYSTIGYIDQSVWV